MANPSTQPRVHLHHPGGWSSEDRKVQAPRFANLRTLELGCLIDVSYSGAKPFWNVDVLEKDLHEGLAQWWYEGNWFHLADYNSIP